MFITRLHELANGLESSSSSSWQLSTTRMVEWCERCEANDMVVVELPLHNGESKTEEEEMTHKETAVYVSKQLLQLLDYHCSENLPVLPTQEQQQQQPIELQLILRTSKNFLRGILQIMYSSFRTRQESFLLQVMTPWRSITRLRQYLLWIQMYCVVDPVLAQHASQILFYTSYNPITGSDDGLMESYQQLLEQDHIMSKLLLCLVQSATNNISLTLSLVRNVHNILVSFPQGMEYTLTAQTTQKDIEDDDNNNNESTIITYANYMPLLALQALEAEPSFPGPSNDKRAEFVMEILRAAYVLRLGKQIETDPQGPFAHLIITLLRLNTTTSKQCEECRREAIPTLMDASAIAVGTFLLKEDILTPLWDILEQQVTQVLDQTLVQDSAAAALTPILIVLHKLSTHHVNIRNRLKLYLFPTEDTFQEQKRREIEQHGKCRNMKPLDAPPGTLRYKLIQLMTWPESHIKRFTGELLWTLCDADAQEFIARVGMGNAVVMLGARGLMQLPDQISSS